MVESTAVREFEVMVGARSLNAVMRPQAVILSSRRDSFRDRSKSRREELSVQSLAKTMYAFRGNSLTTKIEYGQL